MIILSIRLKKEIIFKFYAVPFGIALAISDNRHRVAVVTRSHGDCLMMSRRRKEG